MNAAGTPGKKRRWPAIAAVLLAAAAIAAVGLAACRAEEPQEPASGSEEGRPVLAVGFDRDFPPFTYIDGDGDCAGFDIELAKAVCDACGWTFQGVPIKWDRKDEALEQGDIDCIWSCFSVTTREDQYTWSVPYVNNRIVLLTTADSGIDGLADLAGANVYIQSATNQVDLLAGPCAALERTFKNLYLVDDTATAVLCLRKGNGDAVVIDNTTAIYYTGEYPDELRIAGQALADDRCAVAFRLGDTQTAQAVDEALAALAADGTVAALAEKWGVEEMLCIG